MSVGDKWMLPGGHVGIETEGSTRDVLRVLVLRPPCWLPAKEVARTLCEPMSMRYYHGETPKGES